MTSKIVVFSFRIIIDYDLLYQIYFYLSDIVHDVSIMDY